MVITNLDKITKNLFEIEIDVLIWKWTNQTPKIIMHFQMRKIEFWMHAFKIDVVKQTVSQCTYLKCD